MNFNFKSKLIFLSLTLIIGLNSTSIFAEEDKVGLAIANAAIETSSFIKSALFTKTVGATIAHLSTNSIVRLLFPNPSFKHIALSVGCFCALRSIYNYNKPYWENKFRQFTNPLTPSCSAAINISSNLLPALFNTKTLFVATGTACLGLLLHS